MRIPGGRSGDTPKDERQARFISRELALKNMRDGVVEMLIGFGLIAAGFLSGHPVSMGLIGGGALIAGALQFFKGHTDWQAMGAEPPEPALDLREHPITLAAAEPTPIEDSAYDTTRPRWVPWSIAAAFVIILITGWWSGCNGGGG